MALSCFGDRSSEPGDGDIRHALGSTADLWFALIQHLSERYGPVSEEWAVPGKQHRWSLRIVKRKRRILYLIPKEGGFTVGVVLGDKAVAAADGSPLPAHMIKELNGAKKYAEGRGLPVRVSSAENLHSIKALAALKMGDQMAQVPIAEKKL